jgi:hypothetical protein
LRRLARAAMPKSVKQAAIRFCPFPKLRAKHDFYNSHKQNTRASLVFLLFFSTLSLFFNLYFIHFRPGVVTVYENEGTTKKFFVSSGTITINEDSSVQGRDSPIVKHYPQIKNACFVTCVNSALCSKS